MERFEQLKILRSLIGDAKRFEKIAFAENKESNIFYALNNYRVSLEKELKEKEAKE